MYVMGNYTHNCYLLYIIAHYVHEYLCAHIFMHAHMFLYMHTHVYMFVRIDIYTCVGAIDNGGETQ